MTCTTNTAQHRHKPMDDLDVPARGCVPTNYLDPGTDAAFCHIAVSTTPKKYQSLIITIRQYTPCDTWRRRADVLYMCKMRLQVLAKKAHGMVIICIYWIWMLSQD